MKKIFLHLVAFILTINFLIAQTPQGINYQAVARSANGNPIPNKAISLRLSILNGSGSGTLVYCETQTVTTGAGGLFNVTVGGGTPVTGTFTSIDWSTGGSKWVKIAMDTTGGSNYLLIGSQQLMSVPYALYALNANSSNNGGFTNMQVFATAGTFTFTIPSDVTKIMVEVWGAGGGGGMQWGGSGGGYGKQIFTVIPNSIDTVVVGSGGVGTTSPSAEAGGTSSFGSLIFATGGAGGQIPAGGYSYAAFSISGQTASGNSGGAGANGGSGGVGGNYPTNGTAPGGGGGSGNSLSIAGGWGNNGRVVVWW